MLGVANFLNVASNLPFLTVGVLGLKSLFRHGAVGPQGPVQERAERWPLLVLFAGVLLTAFGSAYYHLAPDNDRLVWDRLPMTVAFMRLFASHDGRADRYPGGNMAAVAARVAGFHQPIQLANGGAASRGGFAPVRLRAVLPPRAFCSRM
jgi:hypothetical protein